MTLPVPPEVAAELFTNSVQLRQGFEGMMLEKIIRGNEEVFNLAKQTREGTLGKPQPDSGTKDGMGVSIGNKTFIYNGVQPSANNGEARSELTPTQTAEPPVQQQPPVVTQVAQPIVQPVPAKEPVKVQVTDSAPAGPPASTVTAIAPQSRWRFITPTLAGLAAVLGATAIGVSTAALLKPSVPTTHPITIDQPVQPPAPQPLPSTPPPLPPPNKPDVSVLPPEKPVQSPPGQVGGWRLGANAYKVDAPNNEEK